MEYISNLIKKMARIPDFIMVAFSSKASATKARHGEKMYSKLIFLKVFHGREAKTKTRTPKKNTYRVSSASPLGQPWSKGRSTP